MCLSILLFLFSNLFISYFHNIHFSSLICYGWLFLTYCFEFILIYSNEKLFRILTLLLSISGTWLCLICFHTMIYIFIFEITLKLLKQDHLYITKSSKQYQFKQNNLFPSQIKEFWRQAEPTVIVNPDFCFSTSFSVLASSVSNFIAQDGC